MPTTTQHEVSTHHTADQLEAINTADQPLEFVRYGGTTPEAGDYVILTSNDGAVFLGHVTDTEEHGRFYVELD